MIKSVLISVPEAENFLGVIEGKQLNSEKEEPGTEHSKKISILFGQGELNDLIGDLNLPY